MEKMPLAGGEKRRTRGLSTPHAGIANAARGDCQRRTRRLKTPLRVSFCKLYAIIKCKVG